MHQQKQNILIYNRLGYYSSNHKIKLMISTNLQIYKAKKPSSSCLTRHITMMMTIQQIAIDQAAHGYGEQNYGPQATTRIG